jgi:di/tricarboxylate transporter
MTLQQALVFIVLIATLLLFAWGRWRYDVVALAAMVTVVVAGIVPADQALQGFGHPAVVTVAAVLVISRALRNSGIINLIASRLAPFTRSTTSHIASLTGFIAIASAFMNNVGALALMLPVALSTASRRKRSPAVLLMPLSFGSLLGGLMTLIGTPPNIIIATYREEAAGEPFRMFDFLPVGGAVALVGVTFIALLGWRLIPKERQAHASTEQTFKINDYIMEVRVREDSPFVGKWLGDIEALRSDDVVPVGLVRGKDTSLHPSRWRRLRIGDLLIVKADPSILKTIIDENGLELVSSKATGLQGLKMEDLKLVEATVAPGSLLEGRDSDFLRQRAKRTLSLIAMARQGQPIRTRLRHQNFRVGDVLLVQGDADLGLLPLAERDLQIIQPRRIGIALGVFVPAVLVSALGLVPVAIAFIAAVIAYVLLDVLPARDLYRDIDWPVIMLLGAMIAVGQALQISGGTRLIATAIAHLTGNIPAVVIMALVMIVTMFLSDIVNNAATAVVMAPIAVGIANQLGVNSDAFLMAVAIGASSAFLTPIGHQSNTLVLGPGGYRFGDYWRMGLPLEILIVSIAVPLITVVWPL